MQFNNCQINMSMGPAAPVTFQTNSESKKDTYLPTIEDIEDFLKEFN